MRIKIKLSKTDKMLPINNQHIVNSFIHRALGKDNKYHDSISNYCVSSLRGGKWIKGTSNISLSNGGYIVVSSMDNEFMDKIILGVLSTPFYQDIKVDGFEFIEEKFHNGWNNFATLSPFIIRERKSDGRNHFVTLRDDDFTEKVQQHIKRKVSKANPTLNTQNIKVEVKEHSKHKVKRILIKNVTNFANQCQISIYCDRKVAELLYNIGIGQSTGSGFGTIHKTENYNVYK